MRQTAKRLSDLLSSLDFSKASEPPPDLAMRDLLIAWLDYQRHEFSAT